MALEAFNYDVEVIQKLSTFPNQEEGLTAEDVKAKFDEAPIALKKYLNDQVVPAVRALQQNVEETGVDLGKLTQNVESLNTNAERVDEALRNMGESIAGAEERIATLEADAKVTDERIATVDGEVADLAQEVMANSAKIGAVAIVCDAEGELITLKDASDLPLVGLKIYGKTTQATTSGKNLISPDAIALVQLGQNFYVYKDDGLLLEPGVYTLSIGEKSSGIYVKDYVSGSDLVSPVWSVASSTFTVTEPTRVWFNFFNSSTYDASVANTIQLEIGNTATAYEPYTGGKPSPNPDYPQELVSAGVGGSVGVKVTGKNLLNLPPHTSTHYLYLYFQAFDGGVRIYGTSSVPNQQDSYDRHYPVVLPAGRYTLKMEVSGITDGATVGVAISKNGALYALAQGKTTGTKTFTIEDGYSYGCFVFVVESGKTVDCVVKAILVPGEQPAEWEPYISPQTVIVPNGLPGIPVTDGGNHTDAEGQMWLAHIAGYEQDGQVGELVTTGYIESYAGETIPGAYISSTGGLDAGASVRYALETPVLVPYDADTQARWRALHTNKPNTTIYNDAGTGMKVSYVADPKAYIDNKFNELAAAIVNNT